MTGKASGADGEIPRQRKDTRPVTAASRRRLVQVGGSELVPFESNLRRPELRERVIERGELVDTLRENTNVPVVVVTGPPGYGKTTLLVQWSNEDERPFAWVRVDAGANDPVVLVTYIMLALQRLGDVDQDVLLALGDESTVYEVLLPKLGRMLAQQDRQFVLVVDDVGALTTPVATDVLMMVAKHLNDGSQLVLAGRRLPDLPLGRLRAERHLLLIGPDDLRFTVSETAAALGAADVDIPADEIEALLRRTEGWPAAVYLAALALSQSPVHRNAEPALDSGDQVVTDYLREQVFGDLTIAQQVFLVRTSILTRLCAPLCDAVLGESGSGDTLRELAHGNLFVVALDNHDQWYRYHRLFGRMLQRMLEEHDPKSVAELHSRASRWLETAGELEEAIRHAQEAHEVARAARLVWSQAAHYIAAGRWPTLRRWLDGFTNDQVIGHAKLSLTAAWCALESGRPVDHWIEAAERGFFDATEPHEAASVEAAIALLHAERGRDGVAAIRVDATRASTLQTADDLWRPFAQYLQAIAFLMAGDLHEARPRLVATERLAADLDLPAHRALCLAQLAAIAVESGDWTEAAGVADEASAVLADRAVADSPTISIVHGVATLLDAKRGRAEEARSLARRSMRMIAVVNECPPWLAVQMRYLLGRAHLLLGDTAAARVLLSEAHTHLRSTPDATWLRDRLAEAWTHVEQFPLATGVGPSALTSAELRVLQLLPTHLSFEQIAQRLLISRNTVKTQAIATYRKLGVTSRSEAVERARSLGMIQG